MLDTPHRLAIIGTGNSVGNHLSAIHSLGERVRLVAAVDVDESRVRAFCSEHDIKGCYTSTAEMLAVEKPDLVHVVTPPATHKELVLQCLKGGAWVYCEKPLCPSLADFDEIELTEKQTGRYVSTVFQWRFGSAAKHVKRLIHVGALGRPLVLVCNTLWYRPEAYYQVPWRGKWSTEGGGPTVSLGIHLMDLCLWLLDDWEEVRAMMGTLDRPIEVEDVSMALVRFANGALGSMINSALSPRQESYLRLDFQRATLELSALYRYDNRHWRFSLPEGVNDDAAHTSWTALEEDLPGQHEVQLAQLLDCMERGERPAVSGGEARRIVEFLACLYKSALTGEIVRRGDITPSDPFYYAVNGGAKPARSSSHR